MLRFRVLLACSLALVLVCACDDRPPSTFDAGPRRDSGQVTMDGGGVIVLPDGAILLPDGAIIHPDGGENPFDGGEEPFDGGSRVCPDNDLGSATGDAVVMASVDGNGDSFFPSCSEVLGGEDRDYLWTAPSAGEWTFDTLGSNVNTTLVAYDGDDCAGATELACDLDLPEVVDAQLRLTLGAGDSVLIVVQESRATQRGTFQLNIHDGVPTTETTCDDSADDDRDGLTDCDDADCAGVGSCP